jgi:hypothetical protein
MEEKRISEYHLILQVPKNLINTIVYKIINTNQWIMKSKIHRKFISHLKECFGDNVISIENKYMADNTVIIFLNYKNNQYLIEICNLGDSLSDDENYVVLALYHALEIEY